MSHATADREERSPRFGLLWVLLAAALAGNALAGPLVLDKISYPLSETLRNQVIGQDLVTLALVVPMCLLAEALALRGHPAAGAIGFAPAGFTAYVFLQDVLGPEYDYYAPLALFHLGVFTLGLAMAIWSWNAVSVRRLPPLSRRFERRHGVVLLGVAGFVVARYAAAIVGFFTGSQIPAAYQSARTFYWSMFLLDLGVVLPGTVVAAVALLRGAPFAGTALYAVVGWFALVPPSVAAMAVIMLINDDPYRSLSRAVILCAVALLFSAWAVRVYRPLFGRRT